MTKIVYKEENWRFMDVYRQVVLLTKTEIYLCVTNLKEDEKILL